MQAMVPVVLGATFANNCEADLAAEAESVSKDFKRNPDCKAQIKAQTFAFARCAFLASIFRALQIGFAS